MAGGHTVTLQTGLKLEGKANQVEVELQLPDAGMITDTRVASERMVMVPSADGAVPMLLPSPSKARGELLRRQILRVGEIPGNPLSEQLFRKLSGPDLAILEEFAEKLDGAALQEVARRGRDS